MQAGQGALKIPFWAGSFIKYKSKVYGSGAQGCCELALGHR